MKTSNIKPPAATLLSYFAIEAERLKTSKVGVKIIVLKKQSIPFTKYQSVPHWRPPADHYDK